MRKAKKQEILNFIESLKQAHEEIKKALEGSNRTLAQNMLGECQEFAITLGNAIENIEGEGCVTITYIEKYCDLLYQIHEGLNEESYGINKVHKLLRKQLLQIENSVKDDIAVRREVVFFPYKASMWDSLESVYLAARKDKECDVYCVPIPYYDLNKDKSFGTMHYEGDEYPEYVEIQDWQTYDFENRRPDVIYIHNPYDSWNLVTSVHPRFYASNLKKYTDRLVYIPYFILEEIKPEEQLKIDGMKHFCFLPGIIHADKVVVQSEDMRRIYINEYKKALQENNIAVDDTQIEGKFLGLGSPKVDKVINTETHDVEIPEAWRKVMEKPDGSRKKMILYNTGIAALLRYNEAWIKKIENTLETFYAQREEVVLLWRPHPLIETTLAGMRSELLEQYRAIRDKYIEENWGIYDDSVDLERAITISDAYYGDASSVVQLYQKAHKPVMIQDVNLLK